MDNVWVLIVLFVLVIGFRILFTIYYYRVMGSHILDMFNDHPVFAWMQYGFTGKWLAEKFAKENAEGLDLEQIPDWALSE